MLCIDATKHCRLTYIKKKEKGLQDPYDMKIYVQ